MTEAEWLACTDPQAMLHFLPGSVSDRKLRLIACAFCRLVWKLMGKASQAAVVLGERLADEPGLARRREATIRAAIEAVCRFEEASGDFFMAADMAYRVPYHDGWYAAEWTIWNGSHLADGVPIIRDVVGNPFRTVAFNPTWRTSEAVAIAQAIYDERAFYHLPVLADALEEAGCHDARILDHCPGLGPHVRGCWVVDAVLGKA